MLLAAAELETWLPALMTTLAAIVAGYYAMRTQRDKLSFDTDRIQDKAEMKIMRAEIARVTAEMTACHAERDTLRQEVRELRSMCKDQQTQIHALQAATGSKHD